MALSQTCAGPLFLGFHFLLVLSLGAGDFHYIYYLPCEAELAFLCPSSPVARVAEEAASILASCPLLTRVVAGGGALGLHGFILRSLLSIHVPSCVPTHHPPPKNGHGTLSLKPYRPESSYLFPSFNL